MHIFSSVRNRFSLDAGHLLFEPRHEKTGFLPVRKQRRRSASQLCEADQRLCFRYSDSTIPRPKFQASSLFLRLHRPVYVGPGRKPRRPVFSRRGSFMQKVNETTFMTELIPSPNTENAIIHSISDSFDTDYLICAKRSSGCFTSTSGNKFYTR